MSNEQTNVLSKENKKKMKESKFPTVFYIICAVFFPLVGLINFGIWHYQQLNTLL